MEKFVIYKNLNCEFQFKFIDKKGHILLSSSGRYTRKRMCIKGIESVKKNSSEDIKFCKKTNSNDEFYFNLKAFNGKIIGVSKVFKSKVLLDKGIKSLKTKAIKASIEDCSKQTIKMAFNFVLDITT